MKETGSWTLLFTLMMSVNLWYKSLLIGCRTRSSAVVLFREKYSGCVAGWPAIKNKNIHRFGFSALYDTIKNIEKSRHGILAEPKNIKRVKSIKIRDEPTNQDVVKNTRSVWRRLYVSVHVHRPDYRGHIQWVQFALQQGAGESVNNTARQSHANPCIFCCVVVAYSCTDIIS